MRIIQTITSMVLLLSMTLFGQWTNESGANTEIAARVNSDINVQTVPDGSGGAFIVWQSGMATTWDIHAQRVDADGYKLWSDTGIVICNANGDQEDPVIIADGSGGAIIAWKDNRSATEVYAQKVNSAGVVQWTVNGVQAASGGMESSPQITTDGSGGVILAWHSFRFAQGDIYAQRILSNGTPAWNATGNAVCGTAAQQIYPKIAANGSGGAIITWEDSRNGSSEVYAQRLNSSGSAQWTSNGVRVATAGPVSSIGIVSADSGAAIVAWFDENLAPSRIRAQYIAADSTLRWTSGGVEINSSTGTKSDLQTVSDDSSGAFLTWSNDGGLGDDIFATRIRKTGVLAFSTVTISNQAGAQTKPVIATDGSNGALIAWQSFEVATNDIYAQKISRTGSVSWTSNGASISVRANDQNTPAIANDGSGGAIVVWQDDRNSGLDIFGQRILSSGVLADLTPPGVPANVTLDSTVAGELSISWSAVSDPGDFARYRIFRGTSPNPTNQVDSTTTSDETDTERTYSQTVGVRKYFRVASVDNNGNVSSYSSQVTGVPKDIQPNAPSNVVISNPGEDSLTVSWNPGTADHFVVFRREGQTPATFVPADAITYTVGQTYGNSILAYDGTSASFNATGLATGQNQWFLVYSYAGTGASTNYNPTAAQANGITLAAEPTNHPTNPVFSNVSPTSMTVTFTVSGAGGYLVLARAGGSPTAIPVDGVGYNVGDSIGLDRVVHTEGSETFDLTQLDPATVYEFVFYPYNQAFSSGSTSNYLTTSPLMASKTTLAGQPVSQPTNLQFSDVTASSFKVTFHKAADNPDGYLVIRRSAFSSSQTPVDAVSYTAGSVINGDSVVYVGSDTSFSQAGLLANTEYFFDVFSFNGSGEAANYLVNSPLEGSRFTVVTEPASQPTAMQFLNRQATTVTVSFSAALGSPNGYLTLRKTGGDPTSDPVDGTDYSVGSSLGDAIVASKGLSTSFPDTGLTPASRAYYKIFSYNGSGSTINYNIVSPLKDSILTLALEPTAQPVSLSFSEINFTSLKVSFTATGSPTGYLVLRRALTAVGAGPVDGNTYAAHTILGNDSVAYVGSATSFTDTGLQSGIMYHYAVFAYNGSGSTTNYLTFTRLSGSQATAQDNVAPQIASPVVNPDPATAGNAIQISVTITDNNVVSSATLAYRNGAESLFGNSQTMTATGNTYSGTIPGTAVGSNGIFYRVIAADGQNNRDTLTGNVGVALPSNSISTQNTSGGAYTSGFPVGSWQMISIPLKLDDGAVPTVLSDFGDPGNKSWRLYEQSTDVSTTGTFVIGKAFWLKQVHIPGGRQITLGTGTTASLADGQITIPPGWSQIGNPFAQSINWQTQTNANQLSALKGPIAWDGVKYVGVDQTNGDPTPVTMLQPWNGYWVHNSGASDITLRIDPTGTFAKGQAKQVSDVAWAVGVSVRAGAFEDSYNYMGVADGATEGLDIHDLPELPYIGDHVSVYFEDEKPLTLSYKPADGAVHTWTMKVTGTLTSLPHTLNYEARSLPAGYSVVFYDVAEKQIVAQYPYEFENRSTNNPRTFKVFAGPSEQVTAEVDAFDLTLPGDFALEQNYPNPFNPSTTIKFDVAKAGNVTIIIYNALGQKVTTITDRYFEPGSFRVDWNGLDDRGHRVASGLYLYRLEAHGISKTRKMIFLK